ncbi:protein-disulfide reductase DsbD [Methylophaga muralis]|uniref:Thiol:disulfide interchange protein DsbD n=1 Tax=Methylophaga muralis TaxID=291169 RepID=A0A1E3GX64_9GAMM|nr:protein-disulfide reductase DsbD [Methylophaga muralis]ODN68166.1 Thiol:disulfide interchange protein DsbD precursor [Methylophaga muralis]
MKQFLILLMLLSSFSAQARPSLLEKFGFNSADMPPEVDEAFAFDAVLTTPETILAGWRIMEGNYLYQDKIRFEITDNDAVQIGEFTLPAGETKNDAYFGLSEVYTSDIQLNLPLIRSQTDATSVTLTAHYQGCSETFGICYPPTRKTINLSLPAVTDSTSPAAAAVEPAPVIPVMNSNVVSQQDEISQRLQNDNLLQILFGFLGLGLLLAFTPCVFPMIPILSGIIVGQGENITTRRAFVLSLIYVLAMSVTYTTAGVLTGLLGGNLQAMLQNPWVISSFVGILLLLSLSMFGFFELQLPHGLQQRLHQLSHRQQGGTLIGVALMGLLSGLIVGPCLAPPLAGALLFISQHADPVLGGAALFAMSIGMGIPLLIIGTSAGTLLPKAGRWMENIKAFFGVMLIALAIWMLDRILPGWTILFMSGALLIISAVYLGALNNLPIEATGWQKLWKGLGLLSLISGALMLIGSASGGNSILQPLHKLSIGNANSTTTPQLQFAYVNSIEELESALRVSNQPVMLDFYADWCTDCKAMEQTTFRDPQVVSTLQNFTLLKVDLTDNTAAHQALLKALRVFGPPSMLFYDKNAEESASHRLVGHVSAAQLNTHLADFLAQQSK